MAADSDLQRLKCVVADDHPAVLRSITLFLAEEGIDVVGAGQTGHEALALIETHGATVAVIDQHLPDMSGVELMRRAHRASPDVALVLYTGDASVGLAREALDTGAHAVVLKEAPLADLTRAVLLAAAGATYVDPVLAGGLMQQPRSGAQLTKREREVLHGLAEGRTNGEIGTQLFLSPETIRTHVRKAMARLGARTRTEAVAAALREGWIT